MNITKSYSAAIKSGELNKAFRDTANIYRKALSFCIEVFELEWLNIEPLDKLQRKQYAEQLIHSVKDRKAKYSDFDTRFYKMPVYFMRGVIGDALGVLSSYHTNLNTWMETPIESQPKKPPKLQINHNAFPTFYKSGLYECDTARIKLYINRDWIWVSLKLNPADVKYIKRHCLDEGWKMESPVLERRYHRWELRFAFKKAIPLSDAELNDRLVMGVDLGVNTDAVCSVMDADGTVLSRKFINFPSEKDRMYHILNKLKGVQRQYSNNNTEVLWRRHNNLNKELAVKIADAVVAEAIEKNVHTIVLEYLDFSGKKKHGSKAQRISLWRRNTIQHLTELRAHQAGIHITHVNAAKTSMLAFDGSGYLERNESNAKLAVFSTGKQYDADLNASYNIAARYLIRSYLEPLSEKRESQLRAKIPELEYRTSCTLNTLRELKRYLAA